jgi:hypothetical protein
LLLLLLLNTDIVNFVESNLEQLDLVVKDKRIKQSRQRATSRLPAVFVTVLCAPLSYVVVRYYRVCLFIAQTLYDKLYDRTSHNMNTNKRRQFVMSVGWLLLLLLLLFRHILFVQNAPPLYGTQSHFAAPHFSNESNAVQRFASD